MRTDVPVSHAEEAMKLEPKGLLPLFKIELRTPENASVFLYLCPDQEVTWQGKTWTNQLKCHITETSLQASGEMTKPKFSITNLNGVWSRYVHQKYTDNAIVTRYRLLRENIESDQNIFEMSMWRMSRVIGMDQDTVSVELRSALDGPVFKIPADTYRPPKYPTVSVQ